jgi:hypothetical protein
MPVCISVMFACPWYQETVEILEHHPPVSVGVHLTAQFGVKELPLGAGGRPQRGALAARDIRLLTYRQLIEMQGPKSMRRPGA